MPESQAQPWGSGAGFGAAFAEWRRQGRKGRFWSFLGPAFIGGIAYIDPGNFVTNIAAGSRYGDRLLWVVVYANLTAVAISMLAARLGIASGRNLAENCRVHLPRWISMFLWVAAEGAGVATDFAEVLGAVLGLRLVLGLSVGPALALIFGLCLVLADLSDRGHRALEYGMIAIVGIVGVLGIWQWHVARTPAFPWHLSALVVPGLPPGGLWMAVGLFGATVMPHAIFLQSATVLPRERRSPPAQRPALFRMAQADILVALGLASFINVAMLLTAAAIFVPRAVVLSSLTKAAHVIGQGLGPAAALGFGLALMASGLGASGLGASIAGTVAGNLILEGFTGMRMKRVLRRIATFIPTAALILGLPDPGRWLVASQVVLTIALPFAVIPLVWFNAAPRVVGEASLRRMPLALGVMLGAVIVAINGWSLCAPGTFAAL